MAKIKGAISITTNTEGVRLLLARNHPPTRETGKGSGGTLAMTACRWNEPVRDVFRTAPGA